MTQLEMDNERADKMTRGIRFSDIELPSGVIVRVFADGTAYALNAFGGRYVKFAATGVWDYDAPGANLQTSHADQKYEEKNKALTEIWRSLQ